MLVGVGVHLLCIGWSEAADSMAALLLCGAMFLLFHVAGGMGAGDVKLIAAEASLLGLKHTEMLLTTTVLCGAVMALGLMLQKKIFSRTLQNVLALAQHHGRHGVKPHEDLNVLNANTVRLPYAVAILGGVVLTVSLPLVCGVNK